MDKGGMDAAPPPPPRSPASLRWSILRKSLLRRPSAAPDDPSEVNTKNVSRKRGGVFNLIPCHPVDDSDSVEVVEATLRAKDLVGPRDVCTRYKLPLENGPGLVMIQRMEDCVDLNDFEISTRFDIDTTGLVCSWPSEDVLAYFCVNHPFMFRTFFKQFHESLACTVKSLLKRSEVSEAIFLSPKRGDSLVKFIEKIKEIGLDYKLLENYDTHVWNIHQKLLKGDDSTWANYDPDHCYPLLLRMTFPAHEYK
uniref:Calmodulin-lysine N-methyltransferase n=1 Tax=Musa acuminata subsp. malaccensis TaxID=214687 RepID=A0A804L833_MUSAM